jgi:hypothetical protein
MPYYGTGLGTKFGMNPLAAALARRQMQIIDQRNASGLTQVRCLNNRLIRLPGLSEQRTWLDAYAGVDAMRYTRLAGPFAPSVEERILGKVNELVKQLRNAAQNYQSVIPLLLRVCERAMFPNQNCCRGYQHEVDGHADAAGLSRFGAFRFICGFTVGKSGNGDCGP